MSEILKNCHERILFNKPLTLPSLATEDNDIQLESPCVNTPNLSSTTTSSVPTRDSWPCARTPVYRACVLRCRPLTSLKPVIELWIQRPAQVSTVSAGDTVALLVSNLASDVEYCVTRLDLASVLHTRCRYTCENRRRCQIPDGCTVHDSLTHHMDLRTVPNKQFLYALSKCCTDPGERRRLEELSSKEGHDQYVRLVREQRFHFLHVLRTFGTCKPQLRVLFTHLSALAPRTYSVASSHALNPDCFRLIIVLELQPVAGLCSSMLQSLLPHKDASTASIDDRSHSTPHFSPSPHNHAPGCVDFYVRSPTHFVLPPAHDSGHSRLLLIASGTGIAPFLGFIQHLAVHGHGPLKHLWLIYGCRNEREDFWCGHELREMSERLRRARLRVHVDTCFSRDMATPARVTDIVDGQWQVISQWMLDSGGTEGDALVYVCGSRHVRASVRAALTRCVALGACVDEKAAEKRLKLIEKSGRVRFDVWN